ncbi:MAG: hypothetical protein D6780_08105 [Candidatus Dadabacteria bacterium]|nr:MAG: hypothetical protein D6780_08105 [Candidatus Dadabacteria bacterium]
MFKLKKGWRGVLFLLLIFLFFIAGVPFVGNFLPLRIKVSFISAAPMELVSEVKRTVPERTTELWWQLKGEAIKEKLQGNVWIKNVLFRRNGLFSRVLNLYITSREPKAVVELKEGVWLIDSEGVYLKEVSIKEGEGKERVCLGRDYCFSSLWHLTASGEGMPSSKLLVLGIKVLERASLIIGERPSLLRFNSGDDIYIYFRTLPPLRGFLSELSNEDAAKRKFKQYLEVVSLIDRRSVKKRYVDLGFKDMAVIKPLGAG